MPPKVQSASKKGQTSLFSFFNKPATAVAVVEEEPANTPQKSETLVKRSNEESSSTENQDVNKHDSSEEIIKKRKTVIYDEEDEEEVKIKPSKKASTKASKSIVDDEDEWDEAASMKSESGASDEEDSFVVDESDESDESSDDGLVDSDSELENSRKKKKPNSRTSKPPLPPKSKSAPSTATKASRSWDNGLAVTPNNKSQDGKRVLIPFEGSGSSAGKSTPGTGLSAFKQSNHALISPRSSQTASPFFGGTATTPGSQSASGSPGSTAFASPSPTQHLNLPEGVVGRGSHEHNFFSFLLPENRKDANGVRPGCQAFSARTLQVPPKFMQEQTPAMSQWWQFKAQNMDTVLFFKVGKFYELFHMDADIGFAELDLIYMKGTKAHSGFPEVSYGKFASILVSKGYRVARVEQTETPDMLKERNDASRGKKDKVVARELCSVMSKGTRTYCHLDDLSLLESEDPDRLSSSVLVCIKEALFSPPSSATTDSSMEVDSVPADVSAAAALPEYGVCVVDTVLCTITLAQFQDDKQRSRLRTLLARYRPSEVLLEADHHSAHTQGVVQLLAPKAAVEMLSAGSEMIPAADTVKIIQKSQYFGSGKKSVEGSGSESLLRGWPAVLKAVHAGLEDGTSELVLSALGGALWQLRRSLIDYEVLSMGKIYGYIPPDEQTGTAAVASDELTQAVPNLSQCLFTQQDVENHQITFDMHIPEEPYSDMPVCSAEPESAQELEECGEDIKTMTLDEVALTNLEILVNNYDRTEKGSLWAFVNRTKTAFGRRLLRSWLCHPLYRCKDIARRQAAVAELLGPLSEAAESARAAMRGMPDLERLLTRVHSNGLRRRGPIEHPDARAILYENYNIRKIKDFADVLSGFEAVVKVGSLFENLSLSCPLLKLALGTPHQGGKFPRKEIRELLAHFREIFDEKQAKRDGNIRPRPGIDSDFDDAKEDIARIESDLEQYLRQMKKETGINDLKYFGSNKDRYQIEVPMALSNRVPAQWTSKSQKKTHRRYWTSTVEDLLGQLTAAEERLAVAQKDTLRRVFEKFDASFAVWSSAISCVALLDALLALAIVSSFPGYVRPTVRPTRLEDGYTPELSIVGGRHPMLEFSLLQRGEGDCIPNDLQLGGVSAQPPAQYHPRMLLLSGPNMGGKSTLLRQTCLITVLAQVGCWVPADSCSMTPVDRIFTRVGASDRILAGQSTFFVELAETATILSAATKNSLCILDELGRGTATFDGTAIAHAVVEHLVSTKHCRSLFATHYHSLVTDWELDPRVRLGHMDCLVQGAGEGEKEESSATTEEVTFLYKLSEGSSPRSYGINVARLAGLPDAVIELALRQSRAFEYRMQSAHAAAVVAQTAAMSTTGCGSLSHDQVAAVYERLSSLAHSTSPLPELAFVARELWCRLRSLVGSTAK